MRATIRDCEGDIDIWLPQDVPKSLKRRVGSFQLTILLIHVWSGGENEKVRSETHLARAIYMGRSKRACDSPHGTNTGMDWAENPNPGLHH